MRATVERDRGSGRSGRRGTDRRHRPLPARAATVPAATPAGRSDPPTRAAPTTSRICPCCSGRRGWPTGSHLDPAVQYWIINAAAAGLMGRLDLDDTWWAIVQSVSGDLESIDPYELIRSLLGGARVGRSGVRGHRHRPVARADAPGGPLPRRSDLPGRRCGAPEPAVGRSRVQHLPRRRRQHRLEARCRPPRAGRGDALLDSYELERRPVAAQTIADAGAQEKLLAPSFVRAAGADDRAQPRRGADPAGRRPAGQAGRVPQCRTGSRLPLRRITGRRR